MAALQASVGDFPSRIMSTALKLQEWNTIIIIFLTQLLFFYHYSKTDGTLMHWSYTFRVNLPFEYESN